MAKFTSSKKTEKSVVARKSGVSKRALDEPEIVIEEAHVEDEVTPIPTHERLAGMTPQERMSLAAKQELAAFEDNNRRHPGPSG